MGKVGDTVTMFNTTVRTILGVVVVGGISLGSYFGYSIFNEANIKDKALNQANKRVEELQGTVDELEVTIEARDEEIKRKQQKIEEQATALRYLKFTTQLAQVTAKAVYKDADGKTKMVIEFVELDLNGNPITEPKTFETVGDKVFVNALVVKFKDSFIETRIDPERQSSLCLFQRVFGSEQASEDTTDDKEDEKTRIYKEERNASTHPHSYARGQVLSPLEERIWKNFWEIANNPEEQKELGISSNHGEAVSIKAVEGKSYQILMRASGGLSLLTDDKMIVPPGAPAT